MDIYGANFKGPLKIEELSTLPVWSASDERRIIYVADTGKTYYGGSLTWMEFGSGSGAGGESDEYSDLLNSSAYLNCTWDDFDDEDLIDNTNTTATWDVSNTEYDFTAGQILQSDNLYDSVASLTAITECMVHVNYSDTGTPTIQATADGVNWEAVTNNTIHEFTNTGTTLKIRFTGGGTGSVESWGVLYNPDTGSNIGANRRKYIAFYYEGLCQDEDTIVDGFYFDNSVAIDQLTLFTRVAPTGSDLTVDLLSDGAEQSAVATLTDGSSYEETTIVTKYYTSSERFGLKIKSIGSGEAGQGLTIIVHYYDTL
jgi:hypothetical protein